MMDEFTDVIQEYFERQIKDETRTELMCSKVREKKQRDSCKNKQAREPCDVDESKVNNSDLSHSKYNRWDLKNRMSLNPKNKFVHLILGSNSELFTVLFVSLMIHVLLIAWAVIHDRIFKFSYTDIDYIVFSDAARFVRNGGSPYERSTYRYSPIIAYLLYPNGFTNELWGKFLFSGCNLIVGTILYDILRTIRGLDIKRAMKFTYFWILNPYIIVLATRGSSDSLIAIAICYLIRDMLMEGPTKKNAAIYALAVSLRMYTAIYITVFWLAISPRISDNVEQVSSNSGIFNSVRHFIRKIQPIFALRRTKWVLTCALTFFTINGIFYYKYYYDFLHETFLYHVKRVDVKHNYSPFFYYLYLSFNTNRSIISKITLTIPQVLITLAIPLIIKDIILAVFCQTLFFVSINKVSTAQYFMWYITFVPIILSNIKLDKYNKVYGVILLLAWWFLQYVWNRLAYRLEYLDEVNVLIPLWLTCLAIYFVNILIMVFVMRNDEYNDFYVPSNTPETDRPYPVLKYSEDENSAIEGIKKDKDITSGNLRYVHRRGRHGVELHTITKSDSWGLRNFLSTFNPVYLLIAILSMTFITFQTLSSTPSKILLLLVVFVCVCCVVVISLDPIEASLLYIPNTGLMIKHSNSLRKTEKFINSLETRSILIVERFYRFKITYGLVAVVESGDTFYVDELSNKKLYFNYSHITPDDIHGHSLSCKLLSHDLELVPLFPVSFCCMNFMISIWRSFNVDIDRNLSQ